MSQDQPGGPPRSSQLVDGARPRDRARSDSARAAGSRSAQRSAERSAQQPGRSAGQQPAQPRPDYSAGLSTRPQPVLDLTDSGHLRSSTPVPERGRSGWLLLLLPLILTLAAGAWFGRGYLQPGENQTLATAGDTSASGEQNPGATEPAGSGSAPAAGATSNPNGATSSNPDLGKVSGKYVLKGPATAPAGTVVVFVLTGPKHGVHTSTSAPYAFGFDSRKIPNGTYSVAVTVIKPGSQPTTQNHQMLVANAKQATPKSSASTGTKKSTGTAGTSGGSTGSTGSTGGGNSSGLGAQAAQVLSLTNDQRAKAGCDPLSANTKLTTAAQAHSADMADHDYFAHNSQDGTSPFTRIQDAGYQFRAAAENIAYGQTTASSVMTAWMNSPGHKANILNCTYTQIGIGYATRGSTPYWTQDFGTPL